MTVSLSALITDVHLGFAARTLTDADVTTYIEHALRIYNDHAPRRLSTSFVTIEDQAEYSLTETWHVIYDVAWSRSTVGFSTNPFEATQVGRSWEVSRGPIRRIEGEKVTGEWRVRDEQIVLEPTPEVAGLTVNVVYGAPHVLNEAGTAYETIPAAHHTVLVDLTLSLLMDREANDAAAEPDYAEGQQRVLHHYRAPAADARAKRLRKRALQRITTNQEVLV